MKYIMAMVIAFGMFACGGDDDECETDADCGDGYQCTNRDPRECIAAPPRSI